ncbi:MAG: hypothetical protein Q9211_004613 [Gyalolechia sp. 1 TL-2023]
MPTQILRTRIPRTQILRFQRPYKCSARSSSTALVARRSATAPVQRRLGLNDICTVFFSTVVFASAIADGNRKNARQEEWVRVIKDAQNDLRTLKADQERRISSLARPVQPGLSSHDVDTDLSEPETWQELFTWAEGEIRERRALGYENWRGIPLKVLREATSSQIKDFQRRYAHFFPTFISPSGAGLWNTVTWPLHFKKTRTLEWSIAYMTLQMMSHAPGPHDSLPYDRPESMDEVFSQVFGTESGERERRSKEMLAHLQRLARNRESDEFYIRYPSPRYPRYSIDLVSYRQGTAQLNAKIDALFETEPLNHEDIPRLLPQICYNLLTSEAPPNIHTYNLLISQFAGHGQERFVKYLLESVDFVHMRTNEISLVETLRYYIRTGQSTGFDDYVDRMNGLGRGLGEASPYLEIPDLVKSQYRVHVVRKGKGGERIPEYYNYADVSEAELYAMEQEARVRISAKPRRNLAVYQTLIQGALSFHGMSEAMTHYRTMSDEGWEPNEEIFLSILRQSLVDGDWDSGIATWTRLQRCCAAAADERAYMCMLQLCQKLNKHDFAQELLRDGIARSVLPPTVFEMGWHRPSQYEVTQDPDKALSEAKTVWTLEQGLVDIVREQRAADEDLPVDLERVNLIISAIQTWVRFPSLDTMALLLEARILSSGSHELSSLDTSLRDSGVQILSMVNELAAIQLSSRIRKFETQLGKACFAMVQYMEDFSTLLFSMCLRGLEACLYSVSTSITQLHDEFRSQKFCITFNRLSDRYDAIEEQTHFIREELSSLVDRMLGPFLWRLEKRLMILHHQIHVTSAEVRESLPEGHQQDSVCMAARSALIGGSWADKVIETLGLADYRQVQGRSIFELLSSDDDITSHNSGDEPDNQRRRKIINKTLRLVQGLHAESNSNGSDQPGTLASQNGQKVVDALLDLLVLEGVYFSLSPGVGVPVERRLKSALSGGFSTRPLDKASGGRPGDQQLLTDIIDSLHPVFLSRKGLAPSINQRMFADLIAAAGELAFSPSLEATTRQRFTLIFNEFIASKSAMDLFPQLTSLLHPSCPDWFRAAISSCLSILPLRPDGVRQAIDFIAGSTSDGSSAPDGPSNQSSARPNVSFDALARATKLLSSTPSTMDIGTWTAALAPQLLDILDDQALDNKRIASYIIGTGFLSKRRLGSPGTAGWRLFVEPIIDSLDPKTGPWPVREDALSTAISRLSALVHLHSNPGVTKRLIGPILLPLWGLHGYALDHRRTSWAHQVHQILSTYMKLSATESQLRLLSDNLLWDGTALWTYTPGSSGGIEIRQRESGKEHPSDMGILVESIDNRIDQFSSLLREAVITDEQLSGIFTHTSKRWLLGSQLASRHERLENFGDDPGNPMEALVSAKLTQKLLEDYKDRIASSIEGTIKLVQPVLSAFVIERQRSTEKLDKASRPSLAGLGHIVKPSQKVASEEEELQETVATALGLLSAVVASSEGSLGTIDRGLLHSIQDSLKYVSQIQSPSDSSTSLTASNVLMLLRLHSEAPDSFESNKDRKDASALAEERNKYHKALQFLSDDLAPVRAQGLSTLTDFISNASPLLNVPSTVILLISLLQDEDEYVYLSAIKALGLLASNHPKTVINALVEKYSDPHEESTVDVRIKVGEALDGAIERLGELFSEETAKVVGESMISVASRRGNRSKTQQKRERGKRKAEKAREEAEEAWDGEMPDEDNDEEAKVNAHVARVVAGWTDTGREEDIRVRTSALSILSTAIETNLASVGITLTSTAIDCVLAILKLEKNEERAILRRAAVLVIMSVVRAIDAAEERGQRLGFGFVGENLREVVTVLRYVELTEADEVVVGHVRAVVESLEAWQQKSILGQWGQSEDREMGIWIDSSRFKAGEKTTKIEELD